MSPFPSATELRAPLLAWLQDAVGPCRYTEPPTPMTPGNDTQVHALALDAVEGPLVLRVFQRNDDPRRPAFESAIQNGLAGQGLPVPRALASCADADAIGAPFFLMERLPGTPLHGDAIGTDADGIPRADWRRALRKGGEMLVDLPRILAEVELRIHAAETKPVVEALTAAGLSRDASVGGRLDQLAVRIESCGLDGLRGGLEWLRGHRPETASEDVVCHCDMQPLNLLVQDGRLTGILDWANASIGPPELELGWTRAIYLTLDLPLPGPLRLLQGAIAGFLSDRYLRVYARSRPIDRAAVGYFEAFRSVVALSILGEWVVRGDEIRDAWNSRSAVDRVRGLVHARSGVDVSIPWRD